MTTSISSKTAVVKSSSVPTWSVMGLLIGLALLVLGFCYESAVIGSIGAVCFLASVIFIACATLNPRFIPGKLLSLRLKRK